MTEHVPPTEPTSAPPASEPAPHGGQYEFSEKENEVFNDVSENLRFGGWGFIALVVAYHAVLLGRWAINGVPMYDRFRAFHIWWPLMVVLMGSTFIRAGRSFDLVVRTKGSDVTHLMTGLKSLNEFLVWLPGTWFVLVIASLIGIVAAVVHALGY